MKYTSAEDVLPEELLKEIQKYVQGRMVYIPTSEGSRKKWGEKWGTEITCSSETTRFARNSMME